MKANMKSNSHVDAIILRIKRITILELLCFYYLLLF